MTGLLLDRAGSGRFFAPLNSGIVIAWGLEEASGTRADSVGSNNLTDSNTVGQQTGKIGNCAHFTAASSQSLTSVSTADLSAGNIDQTWMGWIWLDSINVARTVLSKNTDATHRDYRISTTAGNVVTFQMFTGAGVSVGIATASTFGALSASTWYFVCAQFIQSSQTIQVSINNGAFNTAAASANPGTSTGAFALGADAGAAFWDGRLDAIAFYKRLLSAGEITEAYNGGTGQQYPFFL